MGRSIGNIRLEKFIEALYEHMAGIPLETIARLMRHETINQSFRSYIGIDADELRRAQDRLGLAR